MNLHDPLEESGDNRSHVDRPALCDEVDDALRRDGLVVLCAPWGYGKSTLMADYARLVGRRSERPFVRIDFSEPDMLTYLTGSSTELEASLRDAAPCGTGAAGAPRGPKGASPARRKARRPPLADIPRRYTFAASRAAYLHFHYLAAEWCSQMDDGVRRESIRLGARPLAIIDNVPRLEAAALDDLLAALSCWVAAGAGVVLACEPSLGISPERLPRAHFMGPDALGVTGTELFAWRRKLSIPRDIDVARATNGVPALVAACRRVRAASPEEDEGFLRACGQVVERMLTEPLSAVASSARRSMVIMGSGTFGDVASMGALARLNEMEQLATWYPALGIDLLAGSFRCVPTPCDPGYSCVRECAAPDDKLGMRCVIHMLAREDFARAASVAVFLPLDDQAALLESRAEELADVLPGAAVERVLEGLGAERDGCSSRRGLCGIRGFLALCSDGSVSPEDGKMPEFVEEISAVLAFWYGRPVLSGSPACEGAVRALGRAAMAQDAAALDGALASLEGILDQRDDNLGATVLRCHALVCAVMCGRASEALPWFAPHAERLQSRRTNPRAPYGIADALASLCCSFASVVLERPGSGTAAGSALRQIRASARYLERRRVEPAASLARTVEALFLIWHGEEAKAADLMGRNATRWSAVGFLLGQGLARLVSAYASLVDNKPARAANMAKAALKLARHISNRALERLSRLALVIALVRVRDVREVGEHDLRANLERSRILPGIDASVWLTCAVAEANAGDQDAAFEALRSVSLRCGAFGARLAVCATRAFGNDRALFVEHLPSEVRRDFLAVKPLKTCDFDVASGYSALAADRAVPDRGLTVRVFGTMEAVLNGEEVGRGQFGTPRRKGMGRGLDILCLLALAPGMRMKRSDLAAMVHESSETREKRANALSTSVNRIRRALGQEPGGPEYLTGCRGTVGLNYALVDTDVIRFEKAAFEVLQRRDELPFEEVVELCELVGKIYRGGPDEALVAYGGQAARRVEELRTMHGDVMLVAYDLAMARGDFDLALRFSSRAHSADRDRPDVAAAAEGAVRARSRALESPKACAQPEKADDAASAPQPVDFLEPGLGERIALTM